MRLRFIDPADCGCTDCILGEAKPLSQVTQRDIRKLLQGRLIWRAGSDAELTITVKIVIPVDEIDAKTSDELAPMLYHAHSAEVEVYGHTFDI